MIRENKMSIKSGISKCIPYTDYQIAYWSNCYTNMNNEEDPIDVTDCNTDKYGNCQNNITYKIKIGEPFSRGIDSYEVLVQYSLDDGEFITFKSFNKILNNVTPNLENYFDSEIINTREAIEGLKVVDGIFKFRFLYKTNIDSKYKVLSNVFTCQKMGRLPDVSAYLTIKRNGLDTIFIENPDEQLLVSLVSGEKEYLDKVKQGFYYILEREEDTNKYKEIKRSTILNTYTHIFNFGWREFFNEDSNTQKLRVKVVTKSKFESIEDKVVYSNEIILKKYEKPTFSIKNPLVPYHDKNNEIFNNEFIDSEPDQYSAKTRVLKSRLSVSEILSSGIGDYQTNSLIKTLEKETFTNFNDEGFGKKPFTNMDVMGFFNNYLERKDFYNTRDGGTLLTGSFDYLRDYNYRSVELKFRYYISYIYDYMKPDILENTKARLITDFTWECSEKHCEEEMIEGQMVKNNKVKCLKRVRKMNGVVIQEENNLPGNNYIEDRIDPLECKTEYLPRFDGLILHNRYTKNVEGLDLDIALGFKDQKGLPNGAVGFGLGNIYQVNGKHILIFGGDDVSKEPQSESVIIYFNNLPEGTNEVVKLELWAGWFSIRNTGDYNLILEGYLGGTFTYKDGEDIYSNNRTTSIYKNNGGTKSFDKSYVVNAPKSNSGVSPHIEWSLDGTVSDKKHIANIYYNIRTKDARLEIL